MKKFSLIPLIILCSFTLFAQTKADFSGIKIYINPGHGGLDSDDRHMLETDFWESQGNLTKGLYLQDLLKKLNATVFISRTTNNTADDKALSAIVAEANAANADVMLAIHSNGFAGNQNQPLVLFRGYDNQPAFADAKILADIMWRKLYEKGNCWTSSTVWVKGDWTFYPDWGTQGLGVLRGLNMPGVLSEGSFHDYIAEGWRLKNSDFLLHEAWALVRSFIEFKNIQPLNHGVIAGIIRDTLTTPAYYFKPGTLDASMPLNNAKVTLKPGDKIYQVDKQNNGFFLFDSVAPGKYKLYFEGIPNFYKDSLEVTVFANKSTLADKNMKYDTTLVPQLLSFMPRLIDSTALNQQFTFTFNIAMNTDSVQKALVIEPSVKLIYTWSGKNTVLKVKPETHFAPKTNYTITLKNSACSKWKVKSAATIQKSFVTKNRTSLIFEKSFPALSQSNVGLYPQIRVQVDAPISLTSAASNVLVYDNQNTIMAKTNEMVFTENGKGIYCFDFAQALGTSRTYRISLNANLADDLGLKLGQTTDINFSTRALGYPSGSVVETFDDITKFWDPEASGSTVGTDNPATLFTVSNGKKISGLSAGKLDYKFINSSGGICRVFDSSKPSVGQNESSEISIWVYGDLSYNALEYWFYAPYSTNKIVSVDTIDWAGWELKSIPFSKIGGSGDRQFHSMVVVQTAAGAKSGTIYFDDAQVNFPLAINELNSGNGKFNVQNYPNPFNESNTLKLELPETSKITIDVLNSQGQIVKKLFAGEHQAGNLTVNWNAAEANSGIYFYKIEISNSSTTHVKYTKCVLVK